MSEIIIFSFIYFVILTFIIYLSKKFNLVDKPNSRKIHLEKIVNTGGIAIYSFLIVIIIQKEISFEIENIIVMGSVVLLTGFVDDKIDLSPSIKLILLLFPILYLIFNGFLLHDLGTYEYINKINLGKFSIIFTILAVGLLINAHNYIDGLDGVLLTNCITSVSYIIFLNVDNEVNEILYYFLICCFVTLFFNLLKEKNYFKIFLGDSGSLFIGFFISFLIIFMFNFQYIHPAYLIWSCWYPIYDFLYVTFKRFIEGKKIYKADKLHLHHFIFEKLNRQKLKSLFIINFINISILIFGYIVAHYLGKIHSLVLFLLLFILFFMFRKIKT